MQDWQRLLFPDSHELVQRQRQNRKRKFEVACHCKGCGGAVERAPLDREPVGLDVDFLELFEE